MFAVKFAADEQRAHALPQLHKPAVIHEIALKSVRHAIQNPPNQYGRDDETQHAESERLRGFVVWEIFIGHRFVFCAGLSRLGI